MAKKELISVIYEDEHLLAINKLPGISSVPDSHTPPHKSALELTQAKYEPLGIEPYLLHRLDALTSGVLLFGKKKEERKVLESIPRAVNTRKMYLTLVIGVPRGNQITAKLRARESAAMVPAETHFKIIHRLPVLGTTCSLIEAEIKTGRRHQIRQHFAQIGCPVVMDREYGDFNFNRKFGKVFQFGRQFLHALSITFEHPFLHKMMTIEAPLTPDLKSLTKKLFNQ